MNEFTEENFNITFDEVQNVIEIQYQGVNAALLAALQAQLDALQAEVDAAISGVNGSLGTLQNDIDSLQSLTTAINLDLQDEALVRSQQDTILGEDRFAGDETLGDSITDVTDTFGAAILAEAAARNAAIASANAIIVTDVDALAITVTGLATDMGAAQADIITVSTALSTETSARAAQYTALQADFGDTNAAVLDESVARADADSALAYEISILSASTGNKTYRQPTAPTSGMVDGDVWYDSDDDNKPSRYDGSSWVATDDTRITTVAAAVVTEASARASADSGLASSISTVSAAVTTEAGTRASADSTIAASVTTEASARASADTALSSSITTVAASVTTEASARASADTTIAASVTTEASARVAADGAINAKYAVRIDVNGRITGYELIGGGGGTDFNIRVDTFRVYNGTTDVLPFSISGGTVYMQNVVIDGNLLVTGTITANKFLTDSGVDLAAIVPGSLNSSLASFDGTPFTQSTGGGATNHCTTADINARSQLLEIRFTGLVKSLQNGLSFNDATASLTLQYSTNSGGSWSNWPFPQSVNTYGTSPTSTITTYAAFDLLLRDSGVLPSSGTIRFRLSVAEATGDPNYSSVNIDDLNLEARLTFRK